MLRRLISLLLVAVFAASAINAQTTSVTFYTANLQHGQGTDNAFDFQRQIVSMADADIIATQERTTAETGWNTPLSENGFTEALYFADPAGGDGQALWVKSATVTVNTTYTHALTNTTNPTSGSSTFGWDGSTDIRRSAAALKVTKGGQQFYVVDVHLCPSKCNDSSITTQSAQRESQITDLKNWISTTLTGGLSVVMLGDFNLAPDQPKIGGGVELEMLTPTYTDLWQAGMTGGVASASWGDRDANGVTDMPISSLLTRTHDTRRIDYIFLTAGTTTFSLTSISVPDTRATCPHALVAGGALPSCSPEVVGGPTVSGEQWDIEDDFGVKPSDHNWVKAVLAVTGAIVTCNHHTNPKCH